MAKLDREFGRFDVAFTDSAEFLNMRPGIRAPAYLFLLALTGWSRKHRTDGLVPIKVAQELALHMDRGCRQLVNALQKVNLVSSRNGSILVTKYSKWQETKEEIEARQAVNRDRQARHRNALVTRESRVTSRVSNGTEKEIEKEIEKENAPPTPSARRLDAFEDEPTTELAKGMHELFQRALTPLDVVTCQAALNQYAYLGVKELLERAYAHLDYCRDHNLPVPRTVEGFSDSWRRENDWRADHGGTKAERVAGGRTTGLTKAFPVAS